MDIVNRRLVQGIPSREFLLTYALGYSIFILFNLRKEIFRFRATERVIECVKLRFLITLLCILLCHTFYGPVIWVLQLLLRS